MNTMQTNLVNLTNNIPYYYLEELLDYANFLKQKSEKENDTDYLESIPGMVDAILEASKEDLKNCSTGWFGNVDSLEINKQYISLGQSYLIDKKSNR